MLRMLRNQKDPCRMPRYFEQFDPGISRSMKEPRKNAMFCHGRGPCLMMSQMMPGLTPGKSLATALNLRCVSGDHPPVGKLVDLPKFGLSSMNLYNIKIPPPPKG